MDIRDVLHKNDTILDTPELHGLRCLYWINIFLLVTDFVMPQYFGVHIGYDITCTRFANIVLVIYVLLNPKILRLFTGNCLKMIVTIPLFLYLFVALYTMVFRTDINAFMLVFLEILTFYMLYFGIRYVIGIRTSFKIVIAVSYFLGVYGLVEYAAGHSLYLQFLSTMNSSVVNTYRSGHYRIMGPCGHPLGYGLVLLLFISCSCIDIEHNKISIFRRPFLLILLIINVFLTGSRSTLGIAVIEIVLLFFFSDLKEKKKAMLGFVVLFASFCVLLLFTYNSSIGRYIMMQITSIIDLALGTEYSANYGADITTLKNSEGYREYLPLIFKLDWLNPIIGRGVKRSFGAEFVAEDGSIVYIKSIDNYYVAQYIKYAYPGLISYVLFVISVAVKMLMNVIKSRGGLEKGLFIGFVCYFFNLWYLDALQTLKFMYIFVAIFFAYISAKKKNEDASDEGKIKYAKS